ncbi:hypothetical protein DM01DRAFT_1374171 [Hesseltinella vesiculosa]|uniref:Actin-like ATPase domain-containing protein n=1 Tax=Hesseltinella vesiculosa TaxID=101127 RepID=A0A1X2GHQ1_9FUNG|nr:hypothetical protein DM01DRAFT_1374171 [Hesseltinella vesiculosa]
MNPSKDSSGREYAYVIGIDFATTFSGCCFGFIENETVDGCIKTSPPGHDNAKGLADKPNFRDHLLEKFKLYLDEESAATMPPLPNDLMPAPVIANYFRSIHTYICETMDRGFAKNYDQSQYATV